jgi:hypothetical protein
MDDWEHVVSRFVKVMPTDYKRVLQARRASSGTPGSGTQGSGTQERRPPGLTLVSGGK